MDLYRKSISWHPMANSKPNETRRGVLGGRPCFAGGGPEAKPSPRARVSLPPGAGAQPRGDLPRGTAPGRVDSGHYWGRVSRAGGGGGGQKGGGGVGRAREERGGKGGGEPARGGAGGAPEGRARGALAPPVVPRFFRGGCGTAAARGGRLSALRLERDREHGQRSGWGRARGTTGRRRRLGSYSRAVAKRSRARGERAGVQGGSR